MAEISGRERALSDSEQRLRIAASAARLGVFEWDVESDTARWENERMYEIFGRTEAEGPLNQADFSSSCIEREDLPAFETALARAVTNGEDLNYACRIRRQDDGELRWIEVSGRFETRADGTPRRLVGVVADVTEERKQAQQLKMLNERYELVLAGAGAAIWDWDVPRRKVTFSPRWKAIRGFAEDEVGDSEEEWRRGIHPDDIDRVVAAVEAHFRGETPHFAAEYRVRRKDGAWIWIADRGLAQRDEEGRIVRMAGSETDVTERKRAEEALKESEQRLRWALAGTGRGVWDWDLVSGEAWWSTEMYELWGVEPGTTMNLANSLAVVKAQDRGRLRAAVEEAIARHAEYECEYRIDHPEHGERWMAAQGSPVYDASGRPLRLVGTTEDVTERRRQESERARQRELLQRMFDYIPVLLVMWDPELERFTLNRAAEQVTGWTTADANEVDFMSLIYPDPAYRAEVETFMQALEPGWRELTVTGKNGERIPVEWSNIRLADDTMVGIGVDLRERKRADAAVHESEERLRSIVANAAIGFAMTRPDGRFLDANPAYCALTGYQVAELQSMAFSQIIHPDDLADNMRLFSAMLADEIPDFSIENRYLRKDGDSVWVRKSVSVVRDLDDRPRWITVLVEDIGEQRRAEQALRDSELFHRQALESIPGMVFTTSPDGYCDYQSQQWAEYTGVPTSEHLGDGWNCLLHPDDRPRAMVAWQAAVAESADYNLEYRVRRHDGVHEWFKVIARPIRDGAGRIVRWFGAALNIEELKRAEQALQASLNEKEVLLREIHHRVKNNLQVISSLLSVQSAATEDPQQRAVFDDLRDRVRTMALVHEELYTSKDLSKVALDTYAANLLRNLWRAHGDTAAAVELNLELQPIILSVEQALPCGLILNELASNALKHAFPDGRGGQVTVALAGHPDSEVQLTVRDNGVGLPAELDMSGSRSLGLHLVRLLATQLDAELEVSSREGTEFKVRF